ncbi:MAG: hypothetical protein CMN76_11375 [Spirochaetaceae bacterium]|nr:hypothetical protein [Spirochaetaceae bacterium]|tara:strand:- start:117181 stop:117651 length:471 start_codon:yes stop_codon:yes gene_type:complete
MTRIFIHGLEGSSKGYKASLLKKLFPDLICPQFTGSPEERMQDLNDILKDRKDISIVGSSLGGLMAALYALQNPESINRLVLLAPALPMFDWSPFSDRPLNAPVKIYHGIHDDVVPLPPTKELAQVLFSNLEFNEVDDDHRLKKTVRELDFRTLLS